MTITEALDHAGDLNLIDQDIVEEITRFLPGYLWILDNYESDTGLPEYDIPDRPQRLIHCGVCDGEEIEEKRGGRYRRALRQNDRLPCPFCGAAVEVKHVSKGISTLYNRLDAVFYRKSARDPAVVVAISARVGRCYRMADLREPWSLEPDIAPREIAAFDANRREDMRLKANMVWRDRGDGYCSDVVNGWKQVKAMTRLGFGDDCLFMSQLPDRVACSESFRAAIRGTPIERAWHEDYWGGTDGVKALDLITRYPCVEYLTKLGLEAFVAGRINGELPPGLVNWRGRDMASVLRLSKERLGQIKGRRIDLTPELCDILHYIDRQGIRCGIEIADGVARACRNEREPADTLAKALGYIPKGKWAKALKYIARRGNAYYGDIRDIRDYWYMSHELGNNLTDDAEAFPKDFRAAHDRVAARVKAARNREKDVAIERQLKKLGKRFGFEFGGLILRPAASAGEVIREGEELHHCVGSYVDKYASGQTVICVLRRAVDPDTPWRTVEISARTGKVVQDRGLRNDWGEYAMPEGLRAALDLFWEAWGERHKRDRAPDRRAG